MQFVVFVFLGSSGILCLLALLCGQFALFSIIYKTYFFFRFSFCVFLYFLSLFPLFFFPLSFLDFLYSFSLCFLLTFFCFPFHFIPFFYFLYSLFYCTIFDFPFLLFYLSLLLIRRGVIMGTTYGLQGTLGYSPFTL